MVRHGRDLAALPANDLATSPLQADVLPQGRSAPASSGAGPALYGLFEHAGRGERRGTAPSAVRGDVEHRSGVGVGRRDTSLRPGLSVGRELDPPVVTASSASPTTWSVVGIHTLQ